MSTPVQQQSLKGGPRLDDVLDPVHQQTAASGLVDPLSPLAQDYEEAWPGGPRLERSMPSYPGGPRISTAAVPIDPGTFDATPAPVAPAPPPVEDPLVNFPGGGYMKAYEVEQKRARFLESKATIKGMESEAAQAELDKANAKILDVQTEQQRLEAEQQGKLAAFEAKSQSDVAELHEQAQRKIDSEQRMIDSMLGQIERFEIDPQRVLGDGAGKIMAAIAVAMGAFAQGMGAGPNQALAIINAAIEREGDAQKARLAKMTGVVGLRRQNIQGILGRYDFGVDNIQAQRLAQTAAVNALIKKSMATMEIDKAPANLIKLEQLSAQATAEKRSALFDERRKTVLDGLGMKLQYMKAEEGSRLDALMAQANLAAVAGKKGGRPLPISAAQSQADLKSIGANVNEAFSLWEGLHGGPGSKPGPVYQALSSLRQYYGSDAATGYPTRLGLLFTPKTATFSSNMLMYAAIIGKKIEKDRFSDRDALRYLSMLPTAADSKGTADMKRRVMFNYAEADAANKEKVYKEAGFVVTADMVKSYKSKRDDLSAGLEAQGLGGILTMDEYNRTQGQ